MAILEKYTRGLTDIQVSAAQKLYGPCEIIIPSASIPTLLFHEVLNPFYLFQIAAMGLWFWDGYILYAIIILVLSLLSVIAEIYDIVVNIREVKRIAKYECKMQVKRIISGKP
jgi:hypothetical protein